jgi:hypothetical protein
MRLSSATCNAHRTVAVVRHQRYKAVTCSKQQLHCKSYTARSLVTSRVEYQTSNILSMHHMQCMLHTVYACDALHLVHALTLTSLYGHTLYYSDVLRSMP